MGADVSVPAPRTGAPGGSSQDAPVAIAPARLSCRPPRGYRARRQPEVISLVKRLAECISVEVKKAFPESADADGQAATTPALWVVPVHIPSWYEAVAQVFQRIREGDADGQGPAAIHGIIDLKFEPTILGASGGFLWTAARGMAQNLGDSWRPRDTLTGPSELAGLWLDELCGTLARTCVVGKVRVAGIGGLPSRRNALILVADIAVGSALWRPRKWLFSSENSGSAASWALLQPDGVLVNAGIVESA